MQTTESVLDFPQESLDPTIWTYEDGTFKLTRDAETKLHKIVNYVQAKWNLPELSVFIVGSMTSTAYSSESDIDLDFISPNFVDKPQVSDVGWKIKRDFTEHFKRENPEDAYVGTHPVEIYFYDNPFQCMTSVGCYNVLEQKWEVGPTAIQTDDPVSKYYAQSIGVVEQIIEDIRDIVLHAYETAIVIKNSSDEDFRNEQFETLKSIIDEAAQMLKKLKKKRAGYSREPYNKKDALKLRRSMKRHISDAAFKFLDKFGYVQMLKDYCKIADDEITNLDDAVELVLTSLHDNLCKNASLPESEKAFFKDIETLSESSSMLAKSLLVIAGLIAIPSLIPQRALADELAKIPKSQLHYNSKSVTNAINTVALDTRKFGNLSVVNLTNLVATIIYNEAMLDYVKYNNRNCLVAIGNVIDNRAGGDPNRYADVISEKEQFYSAKHVKGGYTDATYVKYDPHSEGVLSKKMKRAWDTSNLIAIRMINRQQVSVIGTRNMIGNKKKDDSGAWEAWGKDGDLTIGSHTFGYRPEHDGYRPKRPPKKREYKVVAGDTLSKIAKRLKVKQSDLITKNNIKDANRIRVGQKLKY